MASQPSIEPLDVLVAIAKPAVNRLIVGLLREIGIGELTTVGSLDYALLQFRHAKKSFKLVICDRLGYGGHLALLKFLRWERDVLTVSLPVICVDAAWTGDELAANRDAGATTTLALPLTKHGLKMSVETAVSDRRHFVMSPTFRGIDRRFAVIKGYKGPFRRAVDSGITQCHGSPRDRRKIKADAGVRAEPGKTSVSEEGTATAGFGWSKAIETGREDIDSEHRSIIDIMNDLNGVQSTAEEDAAVVEKTLSALKDYVRLHFTNEEALMDSFEYSDRKRHKELHAAFARKIESISAGSICVADVRRKLLVSVYDWLMSHITGVDRIMIAQLKGEYGAVQNDPYETQTTSVVDNAHKIVRQIQKLSIHLGDVADAPSKASICRRVSEATERLINLMGLACTRIEVHGCGAYQLRRLGDIRAAVNTNADIVVAEAARNLINYGNRIISGKYGVPLGVGAILIRKTERIQSLVQIIGGPDAMSQTSKAAVAEAMQIAGDVQTLAVRASAELTDVHLLPRHGGQSGKR